MATLNNRISLLDSFRAIAIIPVLLYHFFSRWPTYYPYKNQYDFFHYGYMGVYFFFVISGFVIFYTLNHTENMLLFWKNRLIRLLPSMLISAVIIYAFMNLFDSDNVFPAAHEAKNFAFSLTFIHPAILHTLFKQYNFDYLNGSYWSLWTEIQFYVLISIIFYFNKTRFLSNFLVISFALIITTHIISVYIIPNNPNPYIKSFMHVFDLWKFYPYFITGSLFFIIYNHNRLQKKVPSFVILALIAFIAYTIYFFNQNIGRIILIIFFGLFGVFCYFPKYLKPLKNRYILNIGVSSYFLYLIHEPIGVLLINKFGKYFYPAEFILPIILIIILCSISIFYHKTVEWRFKPVLNRILRKKII